MEDLFRSYWWLLFPLGFFIVSGWDQFMRYMRHRDTLNLIKTYAEQGRDPPQALLDRVAGKMKADEEAEENVDGWDERAERRRYRRLRRQEGRWYQVVLFGCLSAGFAIAAWTDLLGIGEAAVIVAFVMGALCLANLVTALTGRRD